MGYRGGKFTTTSIFYYTIPNNTHHYQTLITHLTSALKSINNHRKSMSLSTNPALALNQVLARIHQAVIGDGCFEQGIGAGLEDWCDMICSEVEEVKERDINDMLEGDIVYHLSDTCEWDPEEYDLISNEDAIVPENIAEALEGVELVGLEGISSMVLQSRVLVSQLKFADEKADMYETIVNNYREVMDEVNDLMPESHWDEHEKGETIEWLADMVKDKLSVNDHLVSSVSSISNGMDRLIDDKNKAEKENKFYKHKLECVKSVMDGLQYQYEVKDSE